jgi:DNA-binding CsgD family transcriptional regulator
LSEEGRKKARRKYAPKVEALEALRLLSLDAAPLLPPLPVEHGLLTPTPTEAPALPSNATWDAALGQTQLSELLAPAQGQGAADPATMQAGYAQLERYLARAWSRAGIPVQQQDDCTQAVFVTLLEGLGRDRFDQLVGDVGRLGIPEVLSRETAEGPDFFRAVDMVKKRAQRVKTFQPLDEQAAAASSSTSTSDDRRGALHEAIARTLNPREAALVYATLQGNSPAEIASQWGVAPKTVSNEKTRVFQKLREALTADLAN